MTCWEFLVNFKFLVSFSEPLQRELVWGFFVCLFFQKVKFQIKPFCYLKF